MLHVFDLPEMGEIIRISEAVGANFVQQKSARNAVTEDHHEGVLDLAVTIFVQRKTTGRSDIGSMFFTASKNVIVATPSPIYVPLTLNRHGHSPHRRDQHMADKIEITDTVAVAGERICSIIERIERVEEEIKDLMEAKKEIFAEAKGEGLDVKILKEILKIRKQDKDARDEHETLLDVYLRAMDAPSSAPLAEAA